MNCDIAFSSSALPVRICREVRELSRPTTAELASGLFGVDAEPFEVAVLKGHDRAAANVRRERHFDLAQDGGIIFEPAAKLPAQQEASGRLPGQHLAPLDLGARLVALEPAAAGERFDDDGDVAGLAE